MSKANSETLQLISPYGGDPAVFNVQANVTIPVFYLNLILINK